MNLKRPSNWDEGDQWWLSSSDGKASACNSWDLGSILGGEDTLEMAIHSSIIAWKIPWTEESDRLYSPWGCKELDKIEWLTHTQIGRPVPMLGGPHTEKEVYGIQSIWLPCGSDSKKSACNARGRDSIPGSERPPGEENGYPLQYSSLENFKDRGAWWAIVHGAAKSWTRLSD